MPRGSFEHHMFQQVGHAGLAVTLVAGADQDGHVDGDVGRGRVGEQKELAAVGQAVFGDPFNGDALFVGGVGLFFLGRDCADEASQAKK